MAKKVAAMQCPTALMPKPLDMAKHRSGMHTPASAGFLRPSEGAAGRSAGAGSRRSPAAALRPPPPPLWWRHHRTRQGCRRPPAA